MESVIKQEKMVRVRCMRRVRWGPTRRLTKVYEEGEEIVIPESKYLASQWNKITHEGGMTWRGSFVLAEEFKPAVMDVKTEDITELARQNEELRKQLAALSPIQALEPLVVVDQAKRTPGKQTGKKDEI